MSLQDMINESIKNQDAANAAPEKEVENKVEPEVKKGEPEKEPENKENPEKPEEKPKKSKKFEPSRGFKTLKEAEEFVESEAFNKWDNASKKEFKNWLKKIKED